jgi:hypothetical protein
VVIQAQLLEPQAHLDKVLLAVVKFLRFRIKVVAEVALDRLAAMHLPVQLTIEVMAEVVVQVRALQSQAKESCMLAVAVVVLTMALQELV